jgi:hypothetical protein
MWIVQIKSFFSDKPKWVEASELGSHRFKKAAEEAAEGGLTASYTWRVVRQATGANGGGA